MEYYSAIKKNEILSCATTWMNPEGIMLGELSQTEKDKYRMTSFFVELKTKQNKQTQTHRYREQMDGDQRQRGGCGGG